MLDDGGAPIGWLQDDHTLDGLGAGQSVAFTATSPQIPASVAAATKTIKAYAFDLESG